MDIGRLLATAALFCASSLSCARPFGASESENEATTESDTQGETQSSGDSEDTEDSGETESGDSGETESGDTGPSCAPDALPCGEACIDPLANPNHCGGCESPCGVLEGCVAGSCEPGATWGPIEHLGDDGGSAAEQPHVAALPDGGAVVAWTQIFSGERRLLYSRYDRVAHTWTPPAEVYAPEAGATAVVALTRRGDNVSLLWDTSNGTTRSILHAEFEPGDSNFSEPAFVAGGDTMAIGQAQAVANANGNLIATWTESDDAVTQVVARHYNPIAGGWDPTQRNFDETAVDDIPASPDLAVDSSGRALLVWVQTKLGATDLYASRFEQGQWTPEQSIAHGNGEATRPVAMLNRDGQAFIGFNTAGASSFGGLVYRRQTNGSWTLTNGQFGITEKVHGSDGQGSEVLLLSTFTQVTSKTLMLSRFEPALDEWADGVDISDSAVGNAEAPAIALGPENYDVVAWQHYEDMQWGVWARRYDPVAQDWHPREQLDAGDASVNSPRVAVDAKGSIFVTWREQVGTTWRIKARRFGAP